MGKNVMGGSIKWMLSSFKVSTACKVFWSNEYNGFYWCAMVDVST